MGLFSLAYYFLAVTLYVLALPFLIFLSFKPKYKNSIPARFFLKNNPPFNEQDGIHFHVCSFGETKALKPILDVLEKKVNITTITHTGQNQAKKYNADVRYLPFEIFLPFWIKRQKVLVVLEAEFWYMLFLVAKLKGAKIILLNARISDKSVKKYQKMAWFYKRIFAQSDMVFAQSEIDKQRLMELGAKHVEVIGNIKLAQKITKTKDLQKPNGKLIVAASTHEGEEALILEAFLKYKEIDKDAKLVVVPRHPERFNSVFELLKKSPLHVNRWSDKQSFDAPIVLVDAMGELNNIYAIADIVILGGAFRNDVGGHNPLEPAYFGCKIISGEFFFDQRELFLHVKNIQIVKNDGIFEALKKTSDMPPSSYNANVDLEKVIKKIKGK